MSLTVKRHYKLLVVLVLLSALLLVGWGDQRIVAYTIEGDGPGVGQVAQAGSAEAAWKSALDGILLPISDAGN